MKSSLYDAMVAGVEQTLEEIDLELLALEHGQTTKNDGAVEDFTRAEIEVPKGHGLFSRCRFTCKLPRLSVNLTKEDIEDGILVNLVGLKVSFISDKRTIYLKAEDLRII